MSKEIEAYVLDSNGSYKLVTSIDEADEWHSVKIKTSEEFLMIANRAQEAYDAMQRCLFKLFRG